MGAGLVSKRHMCIPLRGAHLAGVAQGAASSGQRAAHLLLAGLGGCSWADPGHRGRRGGGGSVLFPGLMRPDELKELAIRIPEDGAYETVGGFLMSALGKIPEVADVVDIDGGSLRVERMDGRRVDRVRFLPDSPLVEEDPNA